jgi:hypothetical protein
MEGENEMKQNLNLANNEPLGNFSYDNKSGNSVKSVQDYLIDNSESNFKFAGNNLLENRKIDNSSNNSNNIVNKKEKSKSKNLIFDKIFFEQKKEEITPYKIIINDYVLKKEYEVDNN